jgi:hypothetical protein
MLTYRLKANGLIAEGGLGVRVGLRGITRARKSMFRGASQRPITC